MTTPADFLNELRSLLGICEQPCGSNCAPPITSWYGMGCVEWCCITVTYALAHAGYAAWHYAYVPAVEQDAKNGVGTMRWLSPGAVCQPSDLVLFDWNFDGVPDHIETVEAVGSDGSLVTIGGNVGSCGCVMRQQHDRSNVAGFVRIGAIANEAPPVVQPTTCIGIASTKTGKGYWLVEANGTLKAHGDAVFHGQITERLAGPIVGIMPCWRTGGYWLIGADGGVFSFNAPFKGSAGGVKLVKPIVGGAAHPSGSGYWLVASDGGIFSYGVPFFGSMGGKHLDQPIVGMASTPTGRGYWLVAADGGIFSFGDAVFKGSMGGKPLAKPIVAMSALSLSQGYLVFASDGGVFAFGAPFEGSEGGKPLKAPITAGALDPLGTGYWEVGGDGGVFAFGSAPFEGTGA